jgi:hypothetical protein
MELVLITPLGDKVERLRRHRRAIRSGFVRLPQGAEWRAEFISEATQFPYGSFDDQMDALSQYLDWIAENPNPPKRPPMTMCEGVGSQGRPLPSQSGVSKQGNGIVLRLGSAGWSMRRSY